LGLSWSINVASGGTNEHPSDEGNAIDSFNIYRDGALIVNVPANTTSYSDTGIINGENHGYRISAVNANGEGALSVLRSGYAVGKPDAPTRLACVHGNGEVSISWNALNVASGSKCFAK